MENFSARTPFAADEVAQQLLVGMQGSSTGPTMFEVALRLHEPCPEDRWLALPGQTVELDLGDGLGRPGVIQSAELSPDARRVALTIRERSVRA